MNQRALTSLALALAVMVLIVTGVMLFLIAHSNVTATIHTMFALLVLIVVGLHVRNNARSLVKHASRGRALWGALIPTAVLLAGVLLEVPGFTRIYDWGNAWRAQQTNTRETTERYQFLSTNAAESGLQLELDIKKGRAFQYPLFAVWIEAGGEIETLYVSPSVPTKTFSGESLERPEALPVWSHRREAALRADAISAATPVHSWHLSSRATRQPFTIYFEVNQSFDWNDYYSQERFPDDPIYSGSGKVGQPSVVYAAEVDLARTYYALEPVGHGHHAGRDGVLVRDLANLTTALEIVDGVLLKIVTAPRTASR